MESKRKRTEEHRPAPFSLPKGEGVARILSSVRWTDVAGFSLCQTWNILCVALPDPITYTSPFLDLRWVSLATTLVLMVLAVLLQRRTQELLKRRAFLYGVGIVAASGSILGPLRAL